MNIRTSSFAVLASIAAISCNKTEEMTVPHTGIEVVEYMPAPGQFINDGFSCSSAAEAAAWAQSRLDENLFVSLGTFGGRITVEVTPEITDKEGYDFTVSGNTLDGYSEPGIVWVSPDGNSWFQLKGKDRESYGYSVTYRQTADGEPGDITWTDSDGKSGKVTYLPQFHKNSYFPAWIHEKEYTLSGTRLENRLRQNSEGIWETGKYMAGYADNLAGDMEEMSPGEANRFDISDAIDSEGRAVSLESIRYIRVQSAVIAPESSPVTGEMSTEVCGFGLLH